MSREDRNVPTRLAGADDRAVVVSTVVAAFRRDPAFRFFFPDDRDYADHAETFVAYLFDKRVEHRTIWMTDRAEAVALWSPPTATESAQFPDHVAAALGADAVARLEQYETAVYDELPPEPHWYLGVLATNPAHAGEGLGRQVMAVGLDAARSDGSPALLETTNPANVGLYESVGWRVASTIEVATLDVRIMRHE